MFVSIVIPYPLILPLFPKAVYDKVVFEILNSCSVSLCFRSVPTLLIHMSSNKGSLYRRNVSIKGSPGSLCCTFLCPGTNIGAPANDTGFKLCFIISTWEDTMITVLVMHLLFNEKSTNPYKK